MRSDSRTVTAGAVALRLDEEIQGCFFARDPDDLRALVIPVADGKLPLDRSAGDVMLSFSAGVRFDVKGESYVSNAAIVVCLNDRLQDTFTVLAGDVARTVDAKRSLPTPNQVSHALARWEELLRARHDLTRDEVVGLWGELWFLLNAPDPDRAVSTWRGPEGESVDFVGGGIGIECKTSLRRLEHHVSQDQVTRPLGDLEVYVLSLWIDQDPTRGRTLADLVEALGARLDDHRQFEAKLLQTGYSRSDAHHYKLRLRDLEPPRLFPIGRIPRVREADYGVSNIRFRVKLDEAAAVTPAEAIALLARLCGE